MFVHLEVLFLTKFDLEVFNSFIFKLAYLCHINCFLYRRLSIFETYCISNTKGSKLLITLLWINCFGTIYRKFYLVFQTKKVSFTFNSSSSLHQIKILRSLDEKKQNKKGKMKNQVNKCNFTGNNNCYLKFSTPKLYNIRRNIIFTLTTPYPGVSGGIGTLYLYFRDPEYYRFDSKFYYFFVIFYFYLLALHTLTP